jgi:hypothetical protein
MLALSKAPLVLSAAAPEWMETVAQEVESRLRAHGVRLTLGGEPTVVPLDPEGPEWSITADGPTKLPLARLLASNAPAGRTTSGLAPAISPPQGTQPGAQAGRSFGEGPIALQVIPFRE